MCYSLWYNTPTMLPASGARDSMKGTLGESSFTGNPEGYVKQGSELGFGFHKGPTFGEHGVAILSLGLII